MALRRSVWTLRAFLAVLVGQLSVGQTAELRKMWEVDLRKAAHLTDGSPDVPVFALRFSPDGQKLAVIADVYKARSGRKSRLVIVDVGNHTPEAQQFDVTFGLLDWGAALNFGWTPSGNIIYALGKAINLAGGTSCELPNQSIFVSDDIGVSVLPDSLRQHTEITFYDQMCKERDKWEVPESWLASDVSTDRCLISILRSSDGAGVGGERLIVDPLRRRVLQRWPENAGGLWKFADQGRVVCQGGAVLNRDRAPAVCRDVDTGREVGETRKNGADPIATAAGANRAVFSELGRRKNPFESDYETTFKGRFIWDFGTSQELASWFPESQTYQNVFKPTKKTTEQFRFAMSPDGQYVAEGGNGIIRFYKLEP
jgi:hypothetical protein